MRPIGRYPGLEQALAELATSDVRALLDAVRVRDDDWFFAMLDPHFDAF